MPSVYLDHPRPIAIAHRGGTEAATENSIEAFRAAYDVGLRYLETDVHLSSDGHLVAFHDDVLDRVTDASGAIADTPFEEIRAARLHGGEQIPTLDELLEAFPDARFNIDPKSDECVVSLAETLRRHDALRRVCIGSFSDARLRRLRHLLGEELCSAAGPAEIARLRAGLHRSRHQQVLPYQCLQVPPRHRGVEIVTERFVSTAHRLGVAVHVWTINDADEMDRLIGLGVDGLFTDVPSVLRGVLATHQLWK